MKFILVMLFIILIILILISIPIYIKTELIRKRNNDKISIKITVMRGLIKFYYETSYVDLVDKRAKIKNNYEESNNKDESMKKGNSRKTEDIIEGYHKIKGYLNAFNDTIQYILRKITINSLSLHLKIGLGDAALTGITYGILWTIMGSFLNVIFNNKEVKNISINLYPDFNDSIFEVDFFCIIKFKIAHIIIAGIKGVKVFIKGGVMNGRSSYTGFNEDNNGKY